jgi:hypothetical protein
VAGDLGNFRRKLTEVWWVLVGFKNEDQEKDVRTAS